MQSNFSVYHNIDAGKKAVAGLELEERRQRSLCMRLESLVSTKLSQSVTKKKKIMKISVLAPVLLVIIRYNKKFFTECAI
jgi:hypothetical protein